MHFGVFDLFKIGVGPSSSHTVGPMKAARLFLERVEEEHGLEKVARVQAEAYGSLALTGSGHATDKAILWGLEGVTPEGADPDALPARIERITSEKTLKLLDRREIDGALRVGNPDPADDLGWPTPHVLRHTRATLLLRAGVSPHDVGEFLGMSVKMVLETYGHHHVEYQRHAASIA